MPLNDLATYVTAGIVPNTVGILGALSLPMVADLSNGHALTMIAFSVPPALNLGLGYARYRDYRRIRGALARHGWDERLARPFMDSWCHRQAVRAAAREQGYIGQFAAYERREGLRWYDVLPRLRLEEVVEQKERKN